MHPAKRFFSVCLGGLLWTALFLWSSPMAWGEESIFGEETQVLEIFIYQEADAESRVMVVHPDHAVLSYPLTWGVGGRNLTAADLDRVIRGELSAIAGIPRLTVTIKEGSGRREAAYIGQQIQRFSFYGMGDVAQLLAEVLKREPLQNDRFSVPNNIQLSSQSVPELDPDAIIGLHRSDSFFPGVAAESDDGLFSNSKIAFPTQGEITKRDIVLRFENKAIVPWSLVVNNPWPVIGMVAAMGIVEQITKSLMQSSALEELAKITKSEQMLQIPQIDLPVSQQAKVVLNGSVSSDRGFSAQIDLEYRFR